ncbi:MAG: hypothetical protein BMS9Abin29_1365 [Gemmatimonadota bacterium]|nr:MAG: hypothetical protein BMS9Abin29_1365 [Gemmatimonadota bacterium]
MTSGRIDKRICIGLLGGLAAALAPGSATAQSSVPSRAEIPSHEFMVVGYGTAGWQVTDNGATENAFFGSMSPLLLFQFGDQFLYEAELEFDIEEGVTNTSLEYAQIDFFMSDHLTMVAGKFLVPFGVFGERLHPTWINRLPSRPPLYGHGGESGPQPLLPVMADFGVMLRGSWDLGKGKGITGSAYITQGPSIEEGHGDGAAGDVVELIPEFQFGEDSNDINNDKMLGGRIAFVLAPRFEIDLSGFTGEFDDDGSRINAYNLAAEYRFGQTELRGEGFIMRYDFGGADAPGTGAGGGTAGTVTAETGGFYVQASQRMGPWQPVARWTRRSDATAATFDTEAGYSQFTFGLDYWFSPSIALMAGLELNDSRSDEELPSRFVIHWAFGF